MSDRIVILANGKFPEHEIPLGYLRNAERIICCDGAADSLLQFGLEPEAIIGDIDSLTPEIIRKFHDRLFRDDDQEINDLTKAVKWCKDRGYDDIVILGATGKREDHTIGNISLLADYAKEIKVIMVTDTGILLPFLKSTQINSLPGQQVSVFSINPETEIRSSGLKFKLDGIKLKNWWRATLNEAVSDSFSLDFKGGPVIVYLNFRE
jgi:thiamine pyrophosphokinase